LFTQAIALAHTGYSDDVSSTPPRKKGVQCEKISCDWPECTRSFRRQSDLVRHRDTIHQKKKKFWCTAPGCNRSESYGGLKRPFPRKDKLNEHVRNIHKATARPNGASTFPVASIPIVVDTTYPAGLDGYANDSRLTAVSRFPGETNDVLGGRHSTWLTGVDIPTGVEGLSSIDERVAVNEITSAGGFIGVGGLANGDNVTSTDELTSGHGLTTIDEFTTNVGGRGSFDEFSYFNMSTSVEGFTSAAGLPSVESFSNVMELTDDIGLTNVESLTNVAVPGFYGYDAISTLIADDGLDWFAKDSTFTQ